MNKLQILKDLIQISYSEGGQEINTIAALSQKAHISRSAIYRYYPEVVEFMKKQRNREDLPASDVTKLTLLTNRIAKKTRDTQELSEACLALILEITMLKEKHLDDLLGKDLKIMLLEEKLSKYERAKPRLVK